MQRFLRVGFGLLVLISAAQCATAHQFLCNRTNRIGEPCGPRLTTDDTTKVKMPSGPGGDLHPQPVPTKPR